jgi:outer membrane protein
MKSNVYKYAVLLVSLASYSAIAENKWGVGVGGMVEDQGYVDVGSKTTVIPLVFFESENLRIYGPTFNYNIATFEEIDFSFIGQYRFDGYEADDGDIFEGMDDSTGAFELGISANYKTGFGKFTLSALTDVASTHDGYEINLSYSKSYNFESSSITPYISIIQKSEDLVDYYYGVQAHEVTDYRSFHLGKSATNIELGIRSSWRVGKHHNFIANASYTAYGSNIKNSSLIDSSVNTKLILGYMYVF